MSRRSAIHRSGMILLLVVATLALQACWGSSQADNGQGEGRATTAAPHTAAPIPSPTVAAASLPPADAAPERNTETPPAPAFKRYTYEVVNVFPHDPTAFTQGLVYLDGIFYEGTGRYGHSSLRKVDPATGAVLQQHNLAAEFFGEGIAVVENSIYQLTWQNGTGFIYDKESFNERQRFQYTTEGWGLTFDGHHLIQSDGSATLYFLDPATLREVRRVDVTAAGEPVVRLNELEYIDGRVLANIWQTDYIVQIDPAHGAVEGVIDLTGLLEYAPPLQSAVDVLNGIAYDHESQRLFVTGKLWPALFEIRLVEQK